MPGRDAHLDRAAHNEAFLETLSPGYQDWAVVATFYAALHYVDAALAVGDQHPRGHAQRQWEVTRHGVLGGIANDFRTLYFRCNDARYQLVPVQPKDIAVEFESVKKAVLGYLEAVP